MQSLQAQAEAIANLYQRPDVGRPSDIGDADLLKQFFAAIEAGNYMEVACDLVGLSSVTVLNWKKRGEAGEQPFDSFVRTLKQARARAEAKLVANVRAASDIPAHWPAGMTALERMFPDRWGKRQDDQQVPRVVVQIGVAGGEVKVGVQLSPPTFAPDSPEEDSAKSLTGSAFALPSSPITAVMVTQAEGCQPQRDALETSATQGKPSRQLPAVESTSGPQPPSGADGGQRSLSRSKARLARHKEKRLVGRGKGQR